MEYASNVLTTASKSSKAKLDKVQNMGLRLIHGALKSTPIKVMEKTADIQPLERRRELKVLAQAEKMKRLTTHPLHDKLKHPPQNRLKRRSINHVTRDLQNQHLHILPVYADDESVEKIEITDWSSLKQVFQLRKTVPGIELKGMQPTEVQKALALDMLDTSYPSTMCNVCTQMVLFKML